MRIFTKTVKKDSGYNSTSASSGSYSTSASSGDYSACVSVGINSTVAGEENNVLSCIEYLDNKPINFAGGVVGQNGIKENVEYTAHNGKLFEVDRTDGIFSIILEERKGVKKLLLNRESSIKRREIYLISKNGLSAHGDTLKLAKEALEKKILNSKEWIDNINLFIEFCKNKEVILNSDLFDWHFKITGSCELGRRQFCETHKIDLKDSMTLDDFIKLTEKQYGSERINVLKTIYKDSKL